MITQERERRAFYDFLRGQIATILFKNNLDKAQCVITTTNGDRFKGELLRNSFAFTHNQEERRAFARAYRQLKESCGYWALSAYDEI